ncbi:MaoC family dehydratase [Breoghania sp.]|uniref:MaoC family dehydratase n=1 Tax=Breoghania sp. TaxID=2065378 RepID=UPI0026150E99|nr:MaoC family dehydratase [Breoghania sp.]MDJ0930690.1 MaoC family dehydratase [Breoghania sp.]
MEIGEITLDDLEARLGDEVGVSDWVSIDQEVIDAFADLTGDRQFIHVGPRRAALEGSFGGTVAHGFLTLSLLPRLSQSALPRLSGVRSSVNYGFDRVRFLAPVPAGGRIRGRFRLKTLERRGPASVLIVWETRIDLDGSDKPALAADWLGLRHMEENV